MMLENNLRLPLHEVFATALGGYQLDNGKDLDLLDFFADRLKVYLREQGVRHDLIQAIFALGGEDDLVRLMARVAALEAFLESEDGANLLVAYRRAANILRIEEKKDGTPHDGAVDPALLQHDEETTLAEELASATVKIDATLAAEDFAAAMAAMAGLRRPIDDFFNEVTVNSEDPAQRGNRLRLLSRIRATLRKVAEFSEIEG
jgi:glycyl-tRNA synthetase beta chain